jgi:hypothetical protein
VIFVSLGVVPFIDHKHRGKNGKLIRIANKQPFFFFGKYKTKNKIKDGEKKKKKQQQQHKRERD